VTHGRLNSGGATVVADSGILELAERNSDHRAAQLVVKRLEPNPYESPRSLDTDLKATAWSAIARGIMRLLILGVVGYASFTAFGLLYWVMSGEDGQATIPWALSVGLLGGIVFPCSEVFNAGLGAEAGFVRRMLVTLGVVLASLIVSGLIAHAFGWMPTSRTSDPWEYYRIALAACVFIVSLVATRFVWCLKQ